MKKYPWAVGIVVSLCITVFASTQRLLRLNTDGIFDLLTFVLFTFLLCMLNSVVHHLLSNNRILKTIPGRFLSGLISIILVGFLGVIYGAVFILAAKGNQFKVQPDVAALSFLFRSFTLSGLYFFIVYYLNVLQQKQKVLLEMEQLKQAQLQARLSSLKEQLSPHFMFNTLNTLNNMTRERPVKLYINEMANVYRYMLQYNENEFVTLQHELAFIESYLYIIKTRFEGAIDIRIDVSEEVRASKMPPLILHMLVENAVKHNIAAESRPLHINLYSEGREYMVIRNNYQPKASVTHSTNKGLENIAQRYTLLFNKEIEIEQSALFFKVKLPVVL